MSKKKSFVFYYDWRDILEPLDNERVGELMCAVLKYVCDKEETDFQDVALKISYNFIVNTIKRDEEKYQDICEKRREWGKLARAKNNESCIQADAEGSISLLKPAYADDNDTDTDNDNDNVNDTDTDNVKVNDVPSSFSKKTPCVYDEQFLSFWSDYPKKVGKGEAYKQWKKQRLGKKDVDIIKASLKWQRKSRAWLDSGGRFVPNPATYISQRRWEDEPPEGLHLTDIADPLCYTDGDILPEYILKGEYNNGGR